MLWHWVIAFGGTSLLLLPSAAAMGLALPALERLVAARRPGSSFFGGLYAANTFGAVVGVLATAFWLIPAHGLTIAASLGALLNLACAVSALVLFRGAGPRVADGLANSPDHKARRATLLRLAGTGLLGIGYEVVALRVLCQVTEETVYTFACALAVFLAGTTLGAAAYQRWWAGRERADRNDRLLPLALSIATVLASAGLWFAESLRAALGGALGSGLWAAIGTEAALALSAFALPTFVMGALFSHLCTRASEQGAGFGEATGWNGAGAALAPVAFGVVAVPLLGPKWSLLLLSAGYLGVLPPRAMQPGWIAVPAAAMLALAALAPRLAFIDLPDGGRVLSYEEGATAAVSVVEDRDGVARLRIDNRQQEGSSASYWFDARQAWLPLLLHPAPLHALFLGMGTGVTAASATRDPGLQVDVVELLPEVIAASRFFTGAFEGPSRVARAHVIAADARRFVKASVRQFDIIVSDNFHPARSGAGSLYTVEHFQAVRTRLAPGGVFCQWLPLHQLDLESLRSIVRSYMRAFPGATAILASNSLETPVVGLVGRQDDARFDSTAVTGRLRHAMGARDLAALGLEDEYAVLGSFVAGPRALQRFARAATANTDDRPVVAYTAPRLTYAPESLPRDRLLQLLSEWTIEPDEVLERAAPAARLRLGAYWRARDRYLEVGRNVQPASDVRRMLAQVQEPLLSVLQISPDFRPAYEPLLQMAQALAAVDPAAARDLTARLLRIRTGEARASLPDTSPVDPGALD
jgi:spermidine synthase